MENRTNSRVVNSISLSAQLYTEVVPGRSLTSTPSSSSATAVVAVDDNTLSTGNRSNKNSHNENTSKKVKINRNRLNNNNHNHNNRGKKHGNFNGLKRNTAINGRSHRRSRNTENTREVEIVSNSDITTVTNAQAIPGDNLNTNINGDLVSGTVEITTVTSTIEANEVPTITFENITPSTIQPLQHPANHTDRVLDSTEPTESKIKNDPEPLSTSQSTHNVNKKNTIKRKKTIKDKACHNFTDGSNTKSNNEVTTINGAPLGTKDNEVATLDNDDDVNGCAQSDNRLKPKQKKRQFSSNNGKQLVIVGDCEKNNNNDNIIINNNVNHQNTLERDNIDNKIDSSIENSNQNERVNESSNAHDACSEPNGNVTNNNSKRLKQPNRRNKKIRRNNKKSTPIDKNNDNNNNTNVTVQHDTNSPASSLVPLGNGIIQIDDEEKVSCNGTTTSSTVPISDILSSSSSSSSPRTTPETISASLTFTTTDTTTSVVTDIITLPTTTPSRVPAVVSSTDTLSDIKRTTNITNRDTQVTTLSTIDNTNVTPLTEIATINDTDISVPTTASATPSETMPSATSPKTVTSHLPPPLISLSESTESGNDATTRYHHNQHTGNSTNRHHSSGSRLHNHHDYEGDDNDADEYLLVCRNMNRCAAMLECREQLSKLKKKMSQLRHEHTKMQLLAALSMTRRLLSTTGNPSSFMSTTAMMKLATRSISIWNALPRKEKWQKEYVLIMLTNCRLNNERPNSINGYNNSNSNNVTLANTATTSRARESRAVNSAASFTTMMLVDEDDENSFLGFTALVQDHAIESVDGFGHLLQDLQTQDHVSQEYQQQQELQHQLHELEQSIYYKSDLPNSLQEHSWERTVPMHLKKDKEIFLARIRTWRFRHYYDAYFAAASMAGLNTPTTTTITTATNNSSTTTYSSAGNNTQRRHNTNDRHILPSSSQSGPRQVPDPSLQPTSTPFSLAMPRTFVIPEPFWNDDEVMKSLIYHLPELLLIVQKPIETMSSVPLTSTTTNNLFPARFWHDPDIFLQFIKSPHVKKISATSFSTIIQKFDAIKIRNNHQLMLTVIGRAPFCFEMMNLNLRNNKTFVLNAFELSSDNDGNDDMPSRNLFKCSQRLKGDVDVVSAAVQRNGLALQHASLSLRKQYDIIKTACNNNPMAFVFALESGGKTLLANDKSFWMNVIFQKLTLEFCNVCVTPISIPSSSSTTRSNTKFPTKSSKRNSGIYPKKSNVEYRLRKLWTLVPSQLKTDSDIVMAAIQAGCLEIQSVPEIVRSSPTFWLKLIQYDPMYWYYLPKQFKSDFKFVIDGILYYPSRDLINDVFLRFQHLKNNHTIWSTIIVGHRNPEEKSPSTVSVTELSDLLRRMAPTSILTDKELMIVACSRDCYVYSRLSLPLSVDRDIVNATLHDLPRALYCIPSDIQLMFPDLIASAIRMMPPTDMSDVFEQIDEALWSTNRDVALAWLSCGGDYLHDFFPQEYQSDSELFLHVAKHNPQDFWCASETLCSNKEFMMQVVEINGHLISEALANLSQDFDIATIAFASTPDLANRYDVNDANDFTFLMTFAKYVRDRLREHKNFQNLILCGMSAAARPGPLCPLPLLDQGKETSQTYKKLLADFVGIPRGKNLHQLQSASKNLATWGY